MLGRYTTGPVTVRAGIYHILLDAVNASSDELIFSYKACLTGELPGNSSNGMI